MEVGLVRSIDIDQTMQQAYLDYAMSVIVARALPDARDGLKPVHRRILYAMFDMGLRPETAYKKSARIVGEVLGKYHPHGDMAVYESMARMAQDFSMRCLLVEGQGNFGSVDGDPPAAMRYTEARLTAPAMEMLADIRKETVNFSDNFDGSLQEPDVLPSALPNLLVNGATGIAVGMSTNIPPHNLGEVVDALVFMLENWERLDDVNLEDLMKYIHGPDFPTGGLIVQDTHEEDLTAAYGMGRGRVTVQARCHIEEITRGRNRIIVTELPYMTNKSSLIEHIAALAREGNLEGITDLRDESDRHGLRIVIELTRTAEPEKVLQELYKRTAMRSTFGIIMLALVDGEPRMLSLKQALRVYLDHRLAVIRRRSEFELARAQARLHILEGLRVALKHLDAIIELIRKAPDADIARDRLMKRFRLSELQAQEILDMQLRRLAALERKKIEDEYKEVLALIKSLQGLLKSPLKMRQTVSTELRQVKDAYGDRRRTQITRLGVDAKSVLPVLTATDLLPEQTVWVSATTDDLVSRTLDEKPPRISGSSAPRFLLQVNTRDTLFLVSERGEAAGIPVQTLPEAENPLDGAPAHKVSALVEGDKLAALFTLPPKEERQPGWFVFTATRQGMVKKTAVEELPGPTGHSFTLVKVNDEDQLGWVRLTDGQADILLVTADGMAIRFKEEAVRSMGLVAAGVGGIKLGARDLLIGMELIPRHGEILLVSSDGKAKRVAADQFPRQGRYGQGVICWKLPRTAQLVGLAAGKAATRLTLLLDKLSPKAMRMDEAPLQTRLASGKSIIDLKVGYQVLGLSIPWAVPRPVAGAKESPLKDVEVPEVQPEQPAPEVEQLSFGMDGTSIPAPTLPKASVIQSTGKVKSKIEPARPREKAVQPKQAALITKTTSVKKPAPAAKAKSATSKTVGAKKVPAKRASQKSKTNAKPPVSKKVARQPGPAETAPKSAKSLDLPSVQTTPKAGKSSPAAPARAKLASPAIKPTKPVSSATAKTIQAKPAARPAAKKSAPPKASKSAGKAKSATPKSKPGAVKPAAQVKNAKIPPKQSLASASRAATSPAKSKIGAKKPAKKAPTAKSALPKIQPPSKGKSPAAKSKVILPPGWKPLKKTSSHKRAGKSPQKKG